MEFIWVCGWIESGGIDGNLDKGADIVEMKNLTLREEWLVSNIVRISETVNIVE